MENLFWNDQCRCSILSNRQPENCYQNETSWTFRPCYAPIFSNFVSPNAKECTSACLFVVGIRSVILYGYIHNQQLFYPMYRGIGNLLFFISIHFVRTSLNFRHVDSLLNLCTYRIIRHVWRSTESDKLSTLEATAYIQKRCISLLNGLDQELDIEIISLAVYPLIYR